MHALDQISISCLSVSLHAHVHKHTHRPPLWLARCSTWMFIHGGPWSRDCRFLLKINTVSTDLGPGVYLIPVWRKNEWTGRTDGRKRERANAGDEGWRGGGGEGSPVARQKSCACRSKSPGSEEEVTENKEEREDEQADKRGKRRKTAINIPELGLGWGGTQISDNKHGSTTPEKQEKTGAYLSSTSCLSLKHDQKHTHLIISVKYSFNKVCVVKNHVILSPS